MVFTKLQTKGLLALYLIFIFFLSGCNQEDFYQKEYLPGLGVPDSDSSTDPDIPPTNTGVCQGGSLIPTSDTFVQNNSQMAKVDILWVVDDSGSMGDEQDQLADNFDVFINQFLTQNADFQMAIITTDATSGNDGEIVGDPSLLNSNAANNNQTKFINDFKNLIRVGTNGSGQEKGLHTTDSFLLNNADNFLRDDAYLILVYLSDEEDQSNLHVDDYLQSYQSYKNNPGLLKAYSIVTTELIGKKWETIGNRYIEMASLTGGSYSSIHQDFHTTLSNMGASIIDLLDSFALSGSPINQNISIVVNDVNQSSGWSFNTLSKTIKFDSNSIPSEGSVITVNYYICQQGV